MTLSLGLYDFKNAQWQIATVQDIIDVHGIKYTIYVVTQPKGVAW